jgi:CPA2 family monovalent cation:H+ antiporter-2
VHEIDLILTLAGALAAALLLGLVAQRVRVSPIVGYLAAGVAVGPFTPGFVAHGALAAQFAELGVVLLMFGVGLNLHASELLAVKRVALPGAILGMVAPIAAGLLVTRAFGWGLVSGVVYGMAIAITSTVVLLRVFADKDLLTTKAGHIAVGWLLVEDLFAVLVLVLLPILDASAGAPSFGAVARSLSVALMKIVALVVFTIVFGRRLVPRILALVARTRSRELFTLAILVIALGVAVGAAKFFGASMALGAFLAGLVVGQSDFASRAASDALPMRDAFAVLFFVAMGMMLDPAQIVPTLPLTLATLAVVLLAKPLVALAVVLLSRQPPRTALTVSLGLGQLGEFTFVVAALATRLGVLPKEATQALVCTAIVAITLNPFVMRLADPASRWLSKLATRHDQRTPASRVDPAFRVIVVGYGPIGRNLVRLLRDSGLHPTVIEMNHETLAELRREGVDAVYGDASQREILHRAGVDRAGSLIFTASGPSDGVIRAAKDLNPKLLVLARAPYMRDTATLREAGATEVVTAEGEVALAMVERVLRQLGATAEQLDRARDRVRRDVEITINVTLHETRRPRTT